MRSYYASIKLQSSRRQQCTLSCLQVLIDLFFNVSIKNVIKSNIEFDTIVFRNHVKEFEEKYPLSKQSIISIDLYYFDPTKTFEYNLWINIINSSSFKKSLCSITNPLKLNDNSYTLSQCIAALLLYNSLIDVINPKNLSLNKRSLIIYEMVQINIKQDILIALESMQNKHRNNRILNIYYNILENKSLYNYMNNLCHFNISKFINPNTGLYDKIFTYPYQTCIIETDGNKCGGSLRINKNVSNIAVAFGNVDGPLISNSIGRICIKCNAKYSYQRIFHNGSIYILNLSDASYYSASNATFIKTDIMKELSNLLCGHTVPFNAFESIYNDRHYDKIQELTLRMKEIDCTLSYRKRYDPILTYKLMIESFFNYYLLLTIFQFLHQEPYIIVTKEEILHVIQKKQEIREKFSKTQPSTKPIHFRERDLFELLYQKYSKKIHAIETQIISIAPVIDYEIDINHFLSYGDGGRVPCQLLCRTPQNQFEAFYNKKLIKPYQLNPHEPIIKCNQCPWKGNKFIHSFIICIDDALIYYTYGLRGTLINHFIQFIELKISKKKLMDQLKKSNAEKTIIQINEKLNVINKCLHIYKAHKQKFEEIEMNITGTNIDIEYNIRSSARLQRNQPIQYAEPESDFFDENEDESDDELQQVELKEDESKEDIPIDRNELNDALDIDSIIDADLQVGCRKEENYIRPQNRVSCGLISIMTLNGFYVNLSQIIHRETPTAIIYILLSLMFSPIFLQWYCYLQGFGWDIICAIYLHLITMFNSGELNDLQVIFLSGIMGFFFLDKFHLKNHVKWLCKTLFNPYSQRWNAILKNKNDQIVEQNWVKLNRIITLKKLSNSRFNFLLFLIKQYCNNETKKKLESKYPNMWYEPLTNFYALRLFDPTQSHSQHRNIQNMKDMERDELQKQMIAYHQTMELNANNRLPTIERKSYTNLLNISYSNIFKKKKDCFRIQPIALYDNQILNMPYNEILPFIHGNLCNKKCLCDNHKRYIDELLSKMDIDFN